MRPTIRNWETSPPMGGWRVAIFIKGQQFTVDGTPRSIVQQICSLQKKNGVFVSESEVWRWCNAIWCGRDPGRCVSKNRDTYSNGGRFASVLSYLRSLKALAANGLKPVPQQLAERRASVCAVCPNNRKLERCGSCVASARVLTRALIGKVSTRHDALLNQCAVCGCHLPAKVHYPLDPRDKNTYPANCWVAREIAGHE